MEDGFMGFELQLIQIVGATVYDFLRRCLIDKKVQITRKDEGRTFLIMISRQIGVMVQILDDTVKAKFEPITLAAAKVSDIDAEIDRAVSAFNLNTQFVCAYTKEESNYRVVYDFSCLGRK